MKKQQCPWCGQYTISFWEKMRVGYRYWGKCKKCGQKWTLATEALWIILPTMVCITAVGTSPLRIWLRLIILLCLCILECILEAMLIPIVKKE